MPTENIPAASLTRLTYTIEIKGTKERVWDILWQDASYRNWTSVFCEGSHAVSDWKEGSRILFLDEKGSGMYSRIDKLLPQSLISFVHLGEIKNGIEMPVTDHSKDWSSGYENYSITEMDGNTLLEVDMKVIEPFVDYLNKTMPLAIKKIKKLAENKIMLTVEALINAPIKKVWNYWTKPKHIMQWNTASDEWHTPAATNDLKPGGKFNYTMAAKDSSNSFDFNGIYEEVILHKIITYHIDGGRFVEVKFITENNQTKLIENFEAENTHTAELQIAGWQSILNNFKTYTETN